MRSFLSNASANSYFTPKHGFGDPVIEVGRAAAVPGSTEARLELPLAIPFESIVRSAYCDILLGKVKQWYAETAEAGRVSKTAHDLCAVVSWPTAVSGEPTSHCESASSLYKAVRNEHQT